MLDKANTAQVIGRSDDAVRLLKALREKDPSDIDATALLARVHVARDEKPQAVQVVTEGLKLSPDHPGLRVLLGQLTDASPEKLREVRRETVAKIEDPFVRAIQLADIARDDGDKAEWLKQLKEAERLKPTDPRVYERLFTYYVSQRQWDQAQPVLEAMARANQDQAGGLLFRFRLAMAKEELQSALSYASQLTQKMPEFSTSWVSLAQAYQKLGQHEEAVQRFIKALEKQNDNVDAISGLVESYVALNRPDDARRYIELGARRFPNLAAFSEMQLRYETLYGDPEKVLPARQQAVTKNPGSVETWVKLAQAQLAAAQSKRTKKDTAAAEVHVGKARETLTQALAKFPDDRRLYAMFTDVALATKNFDEAEATLKQFAAREAWQDQPEPGLMLAEMYARSGRLDEAAATLRVLLDRFPREPGVQLALATVLSYGGKPQDAIAVLTAEDPRVLRERLKLMVQVGQLDEADKVIAAALSKNPASVDLLAFAGLLDMNRNRWAEATAKLQQALELEPRNQSAMYNLAALRLRQPQPNTDEAIRLLTAIRDQNPDNIDARLLLAQAHQARNDVDNAARELDAALQKAPANKEIRLTLAQVYSGAGRWNEAERVLRVGREMPQFANDIDLLRAEMQMWAARKDYPKALERLKQAKAAAPDHPQLVRDHVRLLLDSRDFKGVIALTDPLINADKNLIWALQARAIAKRRLDDKDGALADFEAALVAANAQRSDDAAANVVRTMAEEIGVDEALQRIAERAKTENRWRMVSAYLLHSKGDYAGAAEMVEATLAEYDKLAPEEKIGALRFAGSLYLAMKPQPQVQKAHDAYAKLLALQPNDLFSLNNMACLLAESMNPPRPKDAIEYSTRAYDMMMKAGMREPLIMDTQGWMLTLNGQVDKGIDVLRQAVATRSFPDAHYHLAEAYLKKSYPEEAQKQLELASQHVSAARENKQPVDTALEARIQDATARAKEMIRAKTEAKAQ
jgi:tetratricopeptide (TPR) repeat protein